MNPYVISIMNIKDSLTAAKLDALTTFAVGKGWITEEEKAAITA